MQLGFCEHVGNHTINHLDLRKQTPAVVRREIAGGVPGNIMRAPYGSHGSREDAIARTLGYRMCDWDIDSGDTSEAFNKLMRDGNRKGAVALVRRNVIRDLEQNPNAKIILLHFKSVSLEALNLIIEDVRGRKFGGKQLAWCRIGVKPAPVNVPTAMPC